MTLLLVASIFLQSVPHPPQLIDLEGLSPAQVGERVLVGKDHREIVFVAKSHDFTMYGHYGVLLAEKPVRRGNSCQRKNWKATFRLPSREWSEGAVVGLQTVTSTEQVAIADATPCELVNFASLDDSISPTEGVSALVRLSDLVVNHATYKLDCSDETGSQLCQRIGDYLMFAVPVRIWRKKRDTVILLSGLGKPAQIMVTLPSGAAKRARLEGTGPPPPC